MPGETPWSGTPVPCPLDSGLDTGLQGGRARPYVLARQEGWAQHVHVAVVLILPAVACCIAIGQIVTGQVKLWEVVLMLFLFLWTGLGITVGFHRLLTHRAFRTPKAVRVLLTILGCMAGQGPPIYWVGNHRRHHRYSDTQGDPHSPHWIGDQRAASIVKGCWHAHIGWLFGDRITNTVEYCKDLYRDTVIVSINQHYHLWFMLGLVLPTLMGALAEQSWQGAANGVLWGGGVRLFFSYHVTQSVNSLCHRFGYRSFNTREHSTNNAWLALPTLGESWHNNHHAYASSALFGMRPWEVDIGGIFIRLLEIAGLAVGVARHDPAMLKEARAIEDD